MNGMAMKYGGACPAGFGRGGYMAGQQPMGVALIPAPMAGMAMIVGLLIGVMIGRKKAMHAEMGGMGMGGGDWMMRKKMMARMGMHGHHHHGYAMPECECGEGEGGQAAGEERTEGGA